jgi:acid phosphatase family membrane protein YuiD
MNFVIEFFKNPAIIVPILGWFFAQLLKFIINLCVTHEFKLERLFGDGGMPSGHSATVMSLAAICGWGYGFGSIYFGIVAIVATIVMHDATGVRREAGKHAVQIKHIADIINGMFMGETEHIRTEKLKEFIGHTPLQVFFGALLGIIVTTVYVSIVGMPYCGLA